MQDVILYGRELSRDDLFDDNEKEEITRNMAQLQEHYDELRNFIDDEQEGFVFLQFCFLFNVELRFKTPPC